MQVLDGTLVHSASDLNAYSECLHLTALSRRVAFGEFTRPPRDDETAALIAHKGDEHEIAYLEELRKDYGDRLVELATRSGATRAEYVAAEAESVAAMADGKDYIYQATFFDGTFLGRADFLRKVATPSRFGAWSYEVIDTKLAREPKPYFLVQLCNYSEHLARIQGVAPAMAEIVLGWSKEAGRERVRRFRVDDFSAYYRHLKASYLAAVTRGADAYPIECTHCNFCAWKDACEKRRDSDDHLSIVANMRQDQIAKFEAAGISTVAALATADDHARPKSMRPESFAALRRQAAEQHGWRVARRIDASAAHTYSFRDAPTDPKDTEAYGLARLPEPARGDVFFDMEGDPLYSTDGGLEYLFGVYLPDEDAYRPFWATVPADERAAFRAFVDFIVERQTHYPNLHVYHYAPYETTALKRLMGSHASREDEIDAMLRAGTFVDLFPIVRQSVFISQPSYSIKKVEALYGFERGADTDTKGGDQSIVNFERWRQNQDPAILDDIRRYNEEDCRSTFALREWLVALRAERANGGIVTAWRPAVVIEPEKKQDVVRPEDVEVRALEARMLAGMEAPTTLDELRAMSDDVRGPWLLGNLLQYHRRAQKPEWWEYYNRIESRSELIDDDHKAIGGLELTDDVTPYPVKPRDRSLAHAYRFPEQEHDLREGQAPIDPATKRSPGEIVFLNDAERVLHIKVSVDMDAAAIRALIPKKPLRDDHKRRVVESIARSYEAGSLDARHPATYAMLLGRRPRLQDRPDGARIAPEHATKEALSKLVTALDRSHLVVQGPPGTGKSTKGAHAIVDLLAAGKRVALAAQSHKALHALLLKIEEAADKRGASFAGCHRSSKTNRESPFVSRHVIDVPNAEAYAGCALVSATTYAWADATQESAFDVVVIDEAGQISLADALITSLVATNVVLLGDPQQLPQVDQGTHPVGTDRSILEHLLDGHATIPIDRGVFLETSYRMHPAIDRFVSDAFYEGRLQADAPNAKNRIVLDGNSSAGTRFIEVDHDGRRRRAPEESRLIVDEIAALLERGNVVIRDDVERPLKPCDILVVAPYNRQRLDIEAALEARGIANVKVGTVDKFQGQEAPVVYFSLATSSAELAPRGVDFLLDPHRINVAISRAKALSVIVASPRLLASQAGSIAEMRLLNVLCAYDEAAAANPVETIPSA